MESEHPETESKPPIKKEYYLKSKHQKNNQAAFSNGSKPSYIKT
jgi:hypothetical protein